MAEIVPYFAGLITLIFGIAFYFVLKESKNRM